MTTARPLTETQMDALYRDFPKGRPLSSSNSATVDGFSIGAALANFFEGLGLGEKTPNWVTDRCAEVQKEKITNGSLKGVTTHVALGSGKYTMPNIGILVRADSRDGNKRIALLLDPLRRNPQGWLIAVWDRKTGLELPFPD